MTTQYCDNRLQPLPIGNFPSILDTNETNEGFEVSHFVSSIGFLSYKSIVLSRVSPPSCPNPSECIEGHQESAEPGTPTPLASSTRYRDLPTWTAEINERECHPIKSLQSFEQGLGDSELQNHERDVNELAEWIQSRLQHIHYEEPDQNLKGCKTAHHWKTQRSRHRP